MKKQYILRLTDEQKVKLEKQAARDGRSMNSYLVRLIEQDNAIVRVPLVNQKDYEDYLSHKSYDPRD